MSIRSMERGWGDFVLEGRPAFRVGFLMHESFPSWASGYRVSRASVHHRCQSTDFPALANNDGSEEHIRAESGERARSSVAHVDEQRLLLVYQDDRVENDRVYCESFMSRHDLTPDAMV